VKRFWIFDFGFLIEGECFHILLISVIAWIVASAVPGQAQKSAKLGRIGILTQTFAGG
jgi:hypothetical protein